ncbi:helix-turn-helix domain-containing protein [Bacillus velezensis]|uniref:helix-turn-helix domain-containing protein n=1 Tax=Bacillus velezensis TaxID=492670 RepID=UPI000956D80E|nr:helix-turn-helix transcriptional regulator [Bacillus velezensis]SIS19128.1 Helix-turn-helix [Bacillus velezensis]
MSEQVIQKIAKLIKTHRKMVKQFSTTELANMVGVSQATISNIENGKFGKRANSIATVKIIFEVLDIPDTDPEIRSFLNIKDDELSKGAVRGSGWTVPITRTTKVRFDVAAEVNAKQLQYQHLTDEEQSEINEIFNFESEVLIRSVMDYIQENFDEIQKRAVSNVKKKVQKLSNKINEDISNNI